MVHQTRNRHMQAVMNNLKLIIFRLPYLAAKMRDFGLRQRFVRTVQIRRQCAPDILSSAIHSGIMLFTHAHLTLINRLKPWCGGLRWALCSKWYAMLVCDVIASTVTRMLRAVTADDIITLNVRWWSWTRLCWVWKLPNLSWRPDSALKNTTAWQCRKIWITRC